MLSDQIKGVIAIVSVLSMLFSAAGGLAFIYITISNLERDIDVIKIWQIEAIEKHAAMIDCKRG